MRHADVADEVKALRAQVIVGEADADVIGAADPFAGQVLR